MESFPILRYGSRWGHHVELEEVDPICRWSARLRSADTRFDQPTCKSRRCRTNGIPGNGAAIENIHVYDDDDVDDDDDGHDDNYDDDNDDDDNDDDKPLIHNNLATWKQTHSNGSEALHSFQINVDLRDEKNLLSNNYKTLTLRAMVPDLAAKIFQATRSPLSWIGSAGFGMMMQFCSPSMNSRLCEASYPTTYSVNNEQYGTSE